MDYLERANCVVVKCENVRIPWNVTDFGSITNGEIKINLLLNLRSPRDYVGPSCRPSLCRPFVRACGSVLDRKLLERLMSPPPKLQVMFASEFS